MKKLLIINTYPCHYEIIETVIINYYKILEIDKTIPIKIYLYILYDKSFINYINSTYPNIEFKNIDNYDYYINCTIYDKNYEYIDKQKLNKKYISHEITDRLKKNPNVYFLTPLSNSNFFYANILPFSNNKILSTVPIYIIQGNLNQNRRNLSLLTKILDKNYKYKFIIKLIGRGHLPESLLKYKNKIVLKNNLNFIDYHKEFLDGYCILPLITKKTHPQYYTTKLTSTINYAYAYKLKCLIDKDLQNIYNLDNVEIFNDINDIQSIFEKSLEHFYNKKFKL